jgi:hypothetical protein
LQSIALDFFFLLFDFFQIVQGHLTDVTHRLEHPVAAAAFAVAKGNRRCPVRRMQRLRQYVFYARHQQFGAA